MEYTQEIKGKIHSVESFGSVDGPGVRYIVFLQGCHMRCKYCHNPETWAMEGGEELTAKEVFDKAYRYRNYWKKNGGITVSGGEALLQIDFVIALFKLAKEKGVHTTLDTSGNPFTREEPFFSKFNELMKVTDLFMLDIKQIDDEKHKKLTGHTNQNIIAMGDYISSHGGAMWVRHVLVPGLTDDDEGLKALKTKLDQWGDCVERVEILPYHTLGLAKWKKLNIDYPLDGVRVPTQEEVAHAEEMLGIQK